MTDAAPVDPSADLRAIAAREAEKVVVTPTIEEREKQLETEKREDAARRAAACAAEVDAVCARYRCAIEVEKEIGIGPKGVTRWPRVVVLAKP